MQKSFQLTAVNSLLVPKKTFWFFKANHKNVAVSYFMKKLF